MDSKWRMQVTSRGIWVAFMLCACSPVERTLNVVQAKEINLQEYADGVQDATEALQAMIDSGAGQVELPPGSFRLSKSLEMNLTEGDCLSIQGGSGSRLIMEAAGPALRVVGSHFKSAAPSGFEEQVWLKERMPSLVGFAIEGKHPESDGIAAVGTMQLTLTELHVRSLRHGIHLLENNRNVLIDACHIYENRGVGIFYDQVNLHQSNIVGCHISYCDQGGIVSRGGNVRNVHISGCDIESNMSESTLPTANIFIDCRGSQYGTAEVAITGCTIQHNSDGPDSCNIRILGHSDQAQTSEPAHEGNVAITGNVLSDVQTNIWLEACRGVTITGNTLWMGFEHNLLIDNCSHVVMGSNNFDRNPRYDYGRSNEAKNRLVFRRSRDCTVMGLHVSRVSNEPAVWLQDCDRFNVSGMTILDCEIGLKLENVTRSLFTACLIRDDREQPGRSRPVVIEGGSDNRFDSSFSN